MPETSIKVSAISSKDDLDSLISQINNAQWTSANDISSGEYTAAGLRQYLQQSGHIFLCATANGDFAGMAAAAVLDKAYANNRWLYVDELDVTANCRRLGVGTALMRYLLSFARENKCLELWLGTETDNVSARALYESLQPSEIEPFVGFNYRL